MPEYSHNDQTGYTPASMETEEDWKRAEHREGRHSGRRMDSDCPDCLAQSSAVLEEEVKDPREDPATMADLIRQVWEGLNAHEVARVMPKAVEYGAADLEIMGFVLGMTLNSPRAREREWTPSELQELASAFYALGKIARAFGAYAEGKLPNEDTWHDLGVYARMVQIIRLRGGWMQ